jgi:outer membrane immunogenic protein
LINGVFAMLRKTSTFIIVLGLSFALGQIASAADLPKREYKAPPMLAPTLVYNWTGFYVGGNVGGAWGNIEVTDVSTGGTVSPDGSGFTGGGQIGYDYQMGPWVIGIRNLIDGTSITKNLAYAGPTFAGTINSKAQWYDTLTGRVGYLVQPNLLFYVQGGGAWTHWDVTLNTGGAQVGQLSGTKTGWTAGGGVEWMFVPHWSTFLEYNYMGFGTFSNAVATCIGATCGTFSGKADIQNVLVGLNYKF